MSEFFDIFSLSFYYENNTNLAEKLLPISKSILKNESLLTNEWGYTNTYSADEGLSSRPELEFFKNFILSKSEKLYDRSGYILNSNYKLWVSIFTSSMKSGDKHGPHCHPGAIYSGLIYLQLPWGSSPIQFKGPRDTTFNLVFDKKVKKENIFNYENDGIVTIQPHVGMFLMWDSWAIHRVPENYMNSDDERMTMVFNVGVEKNEI